MKQPEEETHTFGVLVDNEPGALARVVGLFSGRGYNIESLTVGEVDEVKRISRITIVSCGLPAVLRQIKALLERLVPVVSVEDYQELPTSDREPTAAVERELVLVKCVASGEKRLESLRIADIFNAEVVDSSLEHFIFQLTGRSRKLNRFIDLMRQLGDTEICRTGVAALSRGKVLLRDKTPAPQSS